MAGSGIDPGVKHRYLLALAMVLNAHAGDPDDETNVDEITVTATRSRQLVRDQPMRVEVVPQEEVEENRTVAPGNLTNLLNELAGARMESPSSGLGGSSLRLRGMPGRHAQILTDGLALAGVQTDSFSFLQTPPIDLGRVEVVKGVASALYGGSALAGVLNLVSRPPGGGSEMLLGQTSLDGSDADVFFAGREGESTGLTFAGSANYQARRDPDHDGWAELPGYERLTARPRWFSGLGGHGSLFATLGYIGENRAGGTTGDNTVPGGDPFPVSLHTRHLDAGMVTSFTREDGGIVGGKWYAVRTEHRRTYGGPEIEDDMTAFAAEATWQFRRGIHDWTVGAAFQYDDLSVPDVAGVGHVYTAPAVFAQDEFSPAPWVSISASARVDAHSEFGTFVSPRLSALFRLDPAVSLRASLGTGYAPATPLVDEVEDIGFGALEPLGRLRAETAASGSLDLKWVLKPFEINLSAFSSEIRHPLDAEPAAVPGRVQIVNDGEPFQVNGAEVLVGCVIDDLHLLLNTTWLHATEQGPSGRQDTELLPQLTSEVAAIFEFEGRGRAGFEISYTGPQSVHDDPFLTRTPSLLEINALAELTLGRFSIFVNALNLTDANQQDQNPLLRSAGAPPGLGGNPVVDAWAPLVGRNFNLGIRAEL